MNVELSGRDIHLRFVETSGDDEECIGELVRQLTEEERTRAARFFFAKDRLTFALGRVLLRKALAEYHGALPDDYQFVYNPYGKPELMESPGARQFHFNISHTTGLVAVGISIGRDIGVDVESLDRSTAILEIAHSFLAPEEVRILEAFPIEDQTDVFFAIWTLKESYIKARGAGLSIPLTDFVVGLEPLRVSFSPRISDESERWFLWQGRPTPRHVMAIAARRSPQEELRVSTRKILLKSLL